MLWFLLTILSFASGEVTTGGNDLNSLDRISERNQNELCRELNPGQSITMRETLMGVNATQQRDYSARRYRVTRSRENPREFVVDLKTDFVADSSYRGNRSANQLRQYYTERANRCFSQFRSRLRAPDGTNLFLRINSPEATDVPPQDLAIQIGGDNQRSNSLVWSANLTCPTLIHETLHRLGLCDGYHSRETRPDGSTRERCNRRSEEPRQSIMNDQEAAFADRPSGAPRQHDVLLCLSNTSFERSPVRNGNQLPQSCPEGTTEKRRINSVSGAILETFRRYDEVGGYQVYTAPSPPISPLAQAHMRFITRPNCLRDNSLYIRCMANATRFNDSPGGCPVTPPQCENGDYLR